MYFWGVALSGQAFLHAPAIGGLTHPDTYLSWGFHETNLAAAAYALLVRRYRPTWRDWRLSGVAILAYAAVVFPVDAGLWTRLRHDRAARGLRAGRLVRAVAAAGGVAGRDVDRGDRRG